MGKRQTISELDEAAMLAVYKLQQEAYGPKILECMEEILRRDHLSIGAVWTILNRLVESKMLSTYWTDPTNEPGGRRKRIYKLDGSGELALRAKESIRREREMAGLIWNPGVAEVSI